MNESLYEIIKRHVLNDFDIAQCSKSFIARVPLYLPVELNKEIIDPFSQMPLHLKKNRLILTCDCVDVVIKSLPLNQLLKIPS